MTEVISKAILSGLGFMNLTRESIEQTVRDLVDHSKMSEQEGRKVVKEFQRQSARAQEKLEKRVHAAVHKAMMHLDLVGIDGPRKTKKATKKRSRRRSPSPAAANGGK